MTAGERGVMTSASQPRWEDLQEGKGPPSRLTGDMNPIHHDEVFARAAGFADPISVGMLQAGALHAWAAGWLGAESVRRVMMRWHEAVFAGDMLTLKAVVARKYEESGERRVDVDLVATKQTGAVAVSGSATYVVAER